MKHGISEQQWLEYIDGALPARERARVWEHIEACPECAQTLRELDGWRALISEEGARLRLSAQLPEAEIDSLLAGCLERIRAGEPAGLRLGLGWTVTEGMILLRSLMEPMCGLGTARATISLAARRSTADQQGHITERNWRIFVANLSEAIASVCGSAAGRLVSRAGVFLTIGEA